MTIKECILQAVRLLNMPRLAEKVENDVEGEELGNLIGMAKNVIEEICCDYYPLKTSEVVNFSGKKIMISQLKKTPVDIYSIKKGSVNCQFSLFYDKIEAEIDGEAEIVYSYLPQIVSIEDEIPFKYRITPRIVGLGIATEYCVINGMLEALTFDKKYRDSLKTATATKKEKRVKRRVWA